MNVKHKKCECGKHRPTFNLEGKFTAIWCSECPTKHPDAVDVMDKRKCECGKHRPTFNLKGKTTAIWCSECPTKHPDAVDVVDKRKCECGKYRPTFNLKGKTTAIWCSECPTKHPDAIDIKNKKCECGKHRPTFNLEGESKAIWCFECPTKHLDAIDITHINKMCKYCTLTRSSQKFDGFCVYCFIHLFPDRPMSRNYKVREKHVFDEVIKLLPQDIIVTRDKTVGGCSRRRPDLMIDLGTHWICAENDENCHKNYDTTCEIARINELYSDMADRPIILIRFNCDKYSKGKSLFKKDSRTDIDIIANQKEFKERIKVFVNCIQKYLKSESPKDPLTIEYLYYD